MVEAAAAAAAASDAEKDDHESKSKGDDESWIFFTEYSHEMIGVSDVQSKQEESVSPGTMSSLSSSQNKETPEVTLISYRTHDVYYSYMIYSPLSRMRQGIQNGWKRRLNKNDDNTDKSERDCFDKTTA